MSDEIAMFMSFHVMIYKQDYKTCKLFSVIRRITQKGFSSIENYNPINN